MTDEPAHAFRRIALLPHPHRQETVYLAHQIVQWLEKQGITAIALHEWDRETVHQHAEGWDMVISIGGDGTMLRAARASAVWGVPVLGINMGHLGFLTAFDPHGWTESLAAVLRGDYWIEERLMLDVTWLRGDTQVCHDEALNDVVMGRGTMARLVEFETYIDSAWTTTYRADALIVATPTGSTAYALAVGGPILPPELHNVEIVPVAAHLSLSRPLVLSGDAIIEVVIHCSHEAMLAVDGQMLGTLANHDRVVIQATRHASRFVRVGERTYFYRSILDRMEPKQLSSGSGKQR